MSTLNQFDILVCLLRVFFLKLVNDVFINVLINNPEKNEMLINFPILTSWTVHLKYLNEVF